MKVPLLGFVTELGVKRCTLVGKEGIDDMKEESQTKERQAGRGDKRKTERMSRKERRDTIWFDSMDRTV